ncbi:MAG TPA: hypothetical protein VGX97_12095 [bacterium]|nr:hypothetical protein [bacterium]
MVPDADPSDRLAETRHAVERDAHELRARAGGARAKLLAALGGIVEIREILAVVLPRRRPAPAREDRPAPAGGDGSGPPHDR